MAGSPDASDSFVKLLRIGGEVAAERESQRLNFFRELAADHPAATFLIHDISAQQAIEIAMRRFDNACWPQGEWRLAHARELLDRVTEGADQLLDAAEEVRAMTYAIEGSKFPQLDSAAAQLFLSHVEALEIISALRNSAREFGGLLAVAEPEDRGGCHPTSKRLRPKPLEAFAEAIAEIWVAHGRPLNNDFADVLRALNEAVTGNADLPGEGFRLLAHVRKFNRSKRGDLKAKRGLSAD